MIALPHLYILCASVQSTPLGLLIALRSAVLSYHGLISYTLNLKRRWALSLNNNMLLVKLLKMQSATVKDAICTFHFLHKIYHLRICSQYIHAKISSNSSKFAHLHHNFISPPPPCLHPCREKSFHQSWTSTHWADETLVWSVSTETLGLSLRFSMLHSLYLSLFFLCCSASLDYNRHHADDTGSYSSPCSLEILT